MNYPGYWLKRVSEGLISKVQVKECTKEEMAIVFNEHAKNNIKFAGCTASSMSVYYKTDKLNDNGPVINFHYWGFMEGRMFKIGSGGYIPDLHTKPEEKLYEFYIKTFDVKEMKEMKEIKEIKDA